MSNPLQAEPLSEFVTMSRTELDALRLANAELRSELDEMKGAVEVAVGCGAEVWTGYAPGIAAYLLGSAADRNAELDALRKELAEARKVLTLCADTLEGHLDEPQAVSHGECRLAAKAARSALAAAHGQATPAPSGERIMGGPRRLGEDEA